MTHPSAKRRALALLVFFTLFEGGYLVWAFWGRGDHFMRYFGLQSGYAGTATGWIAAGIVTLVFVLSSALRLPSVRANLLRPSVLKAVTIPFAVAVGLLEEGIFRKVIMDALAARAVGSIAQVAVSGLAFGLAHGIWGVFGRSFRAAAGAILATTAFGLALAITYLIGDRSLAPCVVAHSVADLLVEPGLLLAAARGEMRRAAASLPLVPRT